jgi:predicted secreted protein
MNWVSIIAIYALFWVLTAFVILPLGVRNNQELGLETERGHDDGAPGNFSPGKVVLRTTILSLVLFGIYYLNYVYGWIDRHSFDFLIDPPRS